MLRKLPCSALLAAAVLLLTACSREAPSAPEPTAPPAVAAPDAAASLVAYRWQLQSARDAQGQQIAVLAPAPDRVLGIDFVDGAVSVNGGCNRLSVPYTLTDAGQLQLGQGRSTMMACPPPLGDIDAAFTSFLSGTLTIVLSNMPDVPMLQLAAANGTTMSFTGTPTPETRFGSAGTRAFLEVSAEPCAPDAGSTPPCLVVRDVQFDEQGLRTGTPGEWRPLPDGVEGFSTEPGASYVVRVKRFEQASASGGEPAVFFIYDMTVEARTGK